MRRAAWVLAATVAAALVVAVVRQTAILGASRGPDRFPKGHVPLDGEPSAWIFARHGCPHCQEHMLALQRCLAALPARRRALVLARFRLVGSGEAPPEIPRFPDSLCSALGVRLTPTTWLVAADGHVRETWIGPRGERAWRRALDFVFDAAGETR